MAAPASIFPAVHCAGLCCFEVLSSLCSPGAAGDKSSFARTKSPVPQKDGASTRVTTFFPTRLTPYGSESTSTTNRPTRSAAEIPLTDIGVCRQSLLPTKIPWVSVCCSEMYSCQALCASHPPAALCTKWINSTLSLHRISVLFTT